MTIEDEFKNATIQTFRSNKLMGETAVAQVSDEQLHMALDANTNCIAVIMKHIAGNLRSRWTDFLRSDGEKPNRNRDDEFVDTFAERTEVLEDWENGFQCLFDSLESLAADEFHASIYIRGIQHSVPLAIQRSLGHTCYHVGQIVQIARIQAGDSWQTLTIPRGQSEQFNLKNWGNQPPG